ncbi:MAG: D-alanine--D-alanine ligase [Candidatus Eisenbacteria bacterium]
MKVALLMGGRSSEREISLRTGRGIAQALRSLGHDVTSVDTASGRVLPSGEEEQAALPAGQPHGLVPHAAAVMTESRPVADAEVVFLALHGGEGEDGTVQALLELTGKPYTGSAMLASALAMDKTMSKKLFVHEGIPTPEWQLLRSGDALPPVDVARLGGYPIVVKPNAEGSTVGLSIVTAADQLPDAIREAARFGRDILIERFIPGRELTVAVLGDEVLPIVEICPKHGHYDYESKYTSGASEYFCPADLPAELAARVGELGSRAVRALGCRGVARVDFRLSPESQAYCLEVNTIPGMTPTSLVPMAAKARGISYDQLVQRMLDLALEEHRSRRRARSGVADETART